jgi:Tfp pilus assembly protein PilO
MTSNSSSIANSGAARSIFRRITRVHVLAVLGLLVVFDLLFYVVAVSPLDAREQEMLARIGILKQQVEQKTKGLEELRVIAGKVEKARTAGDELLEQITIERRVTFSTLVTELDSAAAEAGIQDRDRVYDMEPIAGTEVYGIVSINANFRGEYEKLVNFLHRIDRSERFLIIESLGASPRSDSSELQVTMRIDTFVRDL